MSVDDTAVAVWSITKWLEEIELQRVSTGEGVGDLSQCYPFQFDGPKRAVKALRTAVEALGGFAVFPEGEAPFDSAREALASIRETLGIKDTHDGQA